MTSNYLFLMNFTFKAIFCHFRIDGNLFLVTIFSKLLQYKILILCIAKAFSKSRPEKFSVIRTGLVPKKPSVISQEISKILSENSKNFGTEWFRWQKIGTFPGSVKAKYLSTLTISFQILDHNQII